MYTLMLAYASIDCLFRRIPPILLCELYRPSTLTSPIPDFRSHLRWICYCSSFEC